MRIAHAHRSATLATAAAFTLLGSCGGSDSSTAPPAPVASSLALISGANQRARITRTLTDPIIVSATTAAGSTLGSSTTTAALGSSATTAAGSTLGCSATPAALDASAS